MKAVKTTYKGLEYRSRLEARWAAFFDSVGWDYNYEPIDLDGWFPDFRLKAYDHRDVLVEVKPFTELQQFINEGVCEKIEHAVKPYPDFEVLLLGVAPMFPRYPSDKLMSAYNHKNYIGYIGERLCRCLDDCHDIDWDFAPLAVGKLGSAGLPENVLMDFCHETQDFRHRLSGAYDGCHGNISEWKARNIVQEHWGNACNQTGYVNPKW